MSESPRLVECCLPEEAIDVNEAAVDVAVASFFFARRQIAARLRRNLLDLAALDAFCSLRLANPPLAAPISGEGNICKFEEKTSASSE